MESIREELSLTKQALADEMCIKEELLETKQALLDEMRVTNKNVRERNEQLRDKINSYKTYLIVPIGLALTWIALKFNKEK